MIAHAVREIANNLPGYLDEPVTGRVEYQSLVERLAGAWRDAGLPIGDEAAPVPFGTPPEEPDMVKVPSTVVQKVAHLLAEHTRGNSRANEKAERLFSAINRQTGESADVLQPAIRQWITSARWFTGKCHMDRGATVKRDSEIFDDEFERQLDVFEELLHTLAAKFFDIVSDIDDILDEANR